MMRAHSCAPAMDMRITMYGLLRAALLAVLLTSFPMESQGKASKHPVSAKFTAGCTPVTRAIGASNLAP